MKASRAVVLVLMGALASAARAEMAGMRVHVLVQPGDLEQTDWQALAQAGADGVVVNFEPGAGECKPEALAAARAAGLEVMGAISLENPRADPDADFLWDTHPEWGMKLASGHDLTGAPPCYGYPEARAHKVAQAEAALAAGTDGVLVAVLPRYVPDDGENAARQWGYNGPVVQAYHERYGSDPREAAPGSVAQLLFVDLKARFLTELFAALRARAGDKRICVGVRPEDLRPETARHRCLDLHALLGQGLVDGVFLDSTQARDLRRIRLHTDREIRAGLFAQEDPVATMLAALRSPGCSEVMLCAPEEGSPAELLRRVTAAVERHREQEAQRAALEAAIEAGELVTAAGVDPEGIEVDQATVHGVAQSFRVPEGAEVEAVGLFCALRGPAALSMADLRVQVCADGDKAPDLERVLAEVAIPATSFEREARYQWGYARLKPALKLAAGETYWLYAPNASGADGSYVWRVTRDGSTYPDGHAWSCRYEYTKLDWVFRLLRRK